MIAYELKENTLVTDEKKDLVNDKAREIAHDILDSFNQMDVDRIVEQLIDIISEQRQYTIESINNDVNEKRKTIENLRITLSTYPYKR